MKKYKRLNVEEREEISRMLAQNCSFQQVAKTLDRHASTISREIAAGSCNKYGMTELIRLNFRSFTVPVTLNRMI